jgi:hypothetical protein
MSRSYHYLVAGFTDLLLDETRGPVSLAGALAECAEQLEGDDRELLKTIQYPFDNNNIVALLTGTGAPFDMRGVFSSEDLAQELKVPLALPDYATRFVEAYREGRELFPGLAPIDQLSWLFYEEMTAHPNEFVRDWYAFERDLRNVLAARGVREIAQSRGEDYRARLQTVIVGRSDVAEQLLKSSAPDFGLAQVAPWAERVFALRRDHMVDYAKGIDSLRWSVLDSLTQFTYFQAETVLALCLKVAMVERWQSLDAQEGKKRLEQLVNQTKSGAGAVRV